MLNDLDYLPQELLQRNDTDTDLYQKVFEHNTFWISWWMFLFFLSETWLLCMYWILIQNTHFVHRDLIIVRHTEYVFVDSHRHHAPRAPLPSGPPRGRGCWRYGNYATGPRKKRDNWLPRDYCVDGIVIQTIHLSRVEYILVHYKIYETWYSWYMGRWWVSTCYKSMEHYGKRGRSLFMNVYH